MKQVGLIICFLICCVSGNIANAQDLQLNNLPSEITQLLNLNNSSGRTKKNSDIRKTNYINKADSNYNNGNYLLAVKDYLGILDQLKHHLDDTLTIEKYALILYKLAHCYHQLGFEQRTEKTLLEGIELIENVNINSNAYRYLLTDLAEYYTNTKNDYNARELFIKAKSLYEINRDLGDEYHIMLFKMAQLEANIGDPLFSMFLLHKCEDYFEATNKENSLNSYDYLIDIKCLLSKIEYNLGMCERAKDRISQCLQLCEGDNKMARWLPTLYSTNAYLLLYDKNESIEECLTYFHKAYELSNRIQKNNIGKDIALIEYLAGNDSTAQVLSLDISKQITRNTLSSLAYMSSNERELFWQYNNQFIQRSNFLLLNCGGDYSAEVYNNILFSKGLLLKTFNFIGDNIMNSDNDSAKIKYHQVQNLYSQLLKRDIDDDSISKLQKKITTLEKQLASTFLTTSAIENQLSLSWNFTIQKSLLDNEVAIEFAVIPELKRDLQFITDSIDTEQYYYAFIVNNKAESPVAIKLCEESQLKEILNRDMGSQITNERRIGNRYTNNDSRYTHGRKLYELIWEPIDKVLEENSTIYFSPAGLLNSFSMFAISDGEKYLIEKYDMHQLSTTAQIPIIKQYNNRIPSSAVIYGGITYDVSREQMTAEANNITYDDINMDTPSQSDEYFASSETERSGSTKWEPLDKSLSEVLFIDSCLRSAGIEDIKLYKLAHATEESFKAMDEHSPQIILISTHGFYISDKKQIEENSFFSMYKKRGSGTASVSPMIRSGLIMAGGNGAWTGKQIVEEIEDGILTAEEVSRLNLNGTELVTLSACQSGLGSAESSEGVFGLQRGFKMAGVKTLVVSLWNVDDEVTSELMKLFYVNWLSSGNKAEAFKKAQMAIKEQHPNPYYWAPFVMID